MFEDGQTGQCGVSSGGIGVPWPKDHYSNPPTVSSLPSVNLALNLIQPLTLDPTHSHSGVLPPLR